MVFSESKQIGGFLRMKKLKKEALILHEPRPDFMREDIKLTKCSSFPKKDFKIGEEELVLHRAHFEGVKVKHCFLQASE